MFAHSPRTLDFQTPLVSLQLMQCMHAASEVASDSLAASSASECRICKCGPEEGRLVRAVLRLEPRICMACCSPSFILQPLKLDRVNHAVSVSRDWSICSCQLSTGENVQRWFCVYAQTLGAQTSVHIQGDSATSVTILKCLALFDHAHLMLLRMHMYPSPGPISLNLGPATI